MNILLRRKLERARARERAALSWEEWLEAIRPEVLRCHGGTAGGAELVEIAAIARGQAIPVQGRRRGRTPTISERLEAVMFLTDLLMDLEASGPNTVRNTVE